MSKRKITYLSDACMITCVVQKDLAEVVLEAAKNSGAQGATINYARGSGVRERLGLLGVAIDEQKEVIRIIVSSDQSDLIFEAMFLAGKLDTPGRGIMYMTNLDRVATYIPDSVLEKKFNENLERAMQVEIGALVEKQYGQVVKDKILQIKGVEYVFFATGRSDDLFEQKQFGNFGEAAIITIIADEAKKKVYLKNYLACVNFIVGVVA